MSNALPTFRIAAQHTNVGIRYTLLRLTGANQTATAAFVVSAEATRAPAAMRALRAALKAL